jgi:hypothetical protein
VVTTVYEATGIGTTLDGRNAEGDAYYTDGEIKIAVLVAGCGQRSATVLFLPLRVSEELIVRAGLGNLGLELRSTKWLLDKTGDASVLGLDNLFYRGIGSHHDEGQFRVCLVCAYILK